MEITQSLTGLWQSISVSALLGYGVLGGLLGMVLGIAAVVSLHRGGWLRRRRRLHHLTMKAYFVLLPAAAAAIGVQAGVLYSVQRQAYVQIDAHRPEVQQLATAYLAEFQTYLATVNLPALQAKESSLQGLVGALVQDYLATHPLPGLTATDSSALQRAGLRLFERFRATLLVDALSNTLTKKASDLSGLDKTLFDQALKTPFSQLFDADFLLGLVKKQVAGAMRGFYIAVGLQFLLLLALVLAEVVISRRLRLHGPQPAAALA